jgi:hypothetical protein
MCTPPRCAALAMFANNDSEPHASTTFTGLTVLAKRHQSITQFIAFHTGRWWRNGYGLRRGRAVLRRNDEPRSVGPLLITGVMVVTVTAGSQCALRSDGRTGSATDDRTNRCPAAAAHCPAYDGARSAAQYCTAHRILRGRLLQWHRKGNGEKG